MSRYIPLELQNQIMKSLPVRSVMRFRSVSKQWKLLIDSPEFVADHTVHNQHAQHLLVQYRDQRDHKRKFVSIVDDDDDDSFSQLKFPLTVPPTIKNLLENDSVDDDDDVDKDEPYRDELRVCGSSYGLFCFFSYSMVGTGKAVIWNPSIRKSLSIRLPDVVKSYAVGFGVCPNTLDPKIVLVKKIWQTRRTFRQTGSFGTTQFYSLSKSWQVKIFTLSSGTWRNQISNDQLYKRIRFKCPDSQVVLGGFIYWFASRIRKPIILSFNLTSEEFNEIPFPDRLSFKRNKKYSVHKIKEAVGVLQCKTKADKQVIKVWMLENRESGSYKKLFTVNLPHASVWTVIGIRKTGQLIILGKGDTDGDDDSSILAVYDPTPPRFKNLGIYGHQGSFLVSSYTESLLLLDHKGALGDKEDDGHVGMCRDTKGKWFQTRTQGKADLQVKKRGMKKARVIY